MRVHRRLQRLAEASAVAIGNFDGFHAGHRRIIESLVATARRRGLAAVALSFHPHPRLFLGQDIRLISTDAQRLEALKRQELDRLFFIDFAAVAGRPAAEFVRRDLLGTLRLQVLVVGDDFRFGRGREGDLGALENQAAAEGFSLIRVPAVEIGGARVTSSRIRKLLESGDMRAAAGLLERPYFIDGVVERGAGRGRQLGFPTMNIASANDILPEGVFRTELEFCGRGGAGRYGGRRLAATFIGRAPAFTDPRRPWRVEAHVPGFRGLVYGRRVRLHFLDKIRAVRTFAEPAELTAQIARDVAALGI
jgi:riboflavin kinase/FMN adenylyltransferase